eukprot:CAMPEP_0171110332 /NCGR_PEP_ID=MMETSP0766_2-20121228/71288_1 /TAXON_ID=439317 /ORGANISM="Gambierdiscus australes, Strain CAWD 149" /LENGTH=265 /DNA_ID=CAMNT_0011572183 /DNA_START=76 /DNA_END=870 /DNA_ORIENTATION=-
MVSLGADVPAVNLSLQAVWHTLGNLVSRRCVGPGYVLVHIAPSARDQGDLLTPSGVASLFPRQGIHLIYAEPNKEVLALWRAHLTQKVSLKDEMSFVNAAICPEDTEEATLFQASERLKVDFALALGPEVLVEHASMNRTRLLGWLRMLSPAINALALDELASYVQNLTVRCLSPSSLLEGVGITPDAIDQLGVDVFGQDALEIVDLFLAMDGFAPQSLTFEYRGHHVYESDFVAALEGTVSSLVARGYDVHRAKEDLFALATWV